MAKQPGVWGVDLGQCALKAIRLEMINGIVTATAFDYIEHPKNLSQPDADPEHLTREALDKFLTRNDLRGDTVAVSVAGQSGLARFVKLPPVEEKKINEIVRFEARQQIPFPLDEVVWDYQKIGAGVVADGFAMETEIGLFAIKRETVLNALQAYQDVSMDVHVVQLAPLALCNFITYDIFKRDASSPSSESAGKRKCIVVLDMGVESSNLVVTDGDRIIWQRPIPIGGNRFTRALTKEMKLTFAKAEHLKKNASKSPDLKKILLAMKSDLAEFVGEVQKSLAFFTSSNREAQIQFMVGLGSAMRLPGLQRFITEKLKLEVRRLPKFIRLTGDNVVEAPVFKDNVMTMAVAYGLALQGLKVARLQTNLLPQDIRVERLVKAKKPWAVSAAAVLLLGMGALAFGYRMEHDAVASPAIAAAMEKTGKKRQPDGTPGTMGKIDHWKKQCQRQQDKNNKISREVGYLVAGQRERLNWLELNDYINSCLPNPDGSNLTAKQAKLYYTEKAKSAYENVTSKSDGKRENDRQYLVQVNLDAVNALYSANLRPYFERLKARKTQDNTLTLDGMPDADEQIVKEKGEVSGGWVVELRGFTYHDDKRKFLIDTIVQNLIERAKEDESGPINKQTVRFVVLYQYRSVSNPLPAQFSLIDRSDLRLLVGGKPPPPRFGQEEKLPDRNSAEYFDSYQASWKPLGDVAREMVEDKPGSVTKKDSGEAEKGDNVRTEFIIHFVWWEPPMQPLAEKIPGMQPKR